MEEKRNKAFLLVALVAIGSILLFINEYYIKQLDCFLYNLIMTIAVSLIVTAIFSFVSNKLSPNNIDKIAAQNFSVLSSCQEYGLCGIYEEFPLSIEPFEQDFINSTKLYVVMNDAKAFISSHTILLKKRMNAKKRNTTFVLQDYNTPDIMSALTRKNGHKEDEDYYKRKVQSVINYHLVPLKGECDNTSEFSAFLNTNYNTLAIILTDNYAMVSIYRIAPGKSRVPHFVFKKGNKEYNDTYSDVIKIIANAKKIKL